MHKAQNEGRFNGEIVERQSIKLWKTSFIRCIWMS